MMPEPATTNRTRGIIIRVDDACAMLGLCARLGMTLFLAMLASYSNASNRSIYVSNGPPPHVDKKSPPVRAGGLGMPVDWGGGNAQAFLPAIPLVALETFLADSFGRRLRVAFPAIHISEPPIALSSLLNRSW